MKMKRNFFFASALVAAATLVGCSNDDEIVKNDEVNGNATAYIKVNIAYANTTPGTRGTSEGYLYGSEAEQTIATADFYFYDAEGNFYKKVSKGALTTTEGTDENKNGSIELIANPVLVLENTADNATPKKLLVVLNSSTDLSNKSLADAAKEITTEEVSTAGKFVMTNTTYVGSTDKGATDQTTATGQWFATELTEDNFYIEQGNSPGYSDNNVTEDEKMEAVNVYVERLAAKVQLSYVTEGENASTTITMPKIELDGKEVAPTMTINGWKLNGKEKKEYLMKSISNSWSFGSNDWEVDSWNAADDHRSYWAISANYNSDAKMFPANFAAVTDPTNKTGENSSVDTDVTGDGYALDYYSWDELTNRASEVEYCRENTLSKDHLTNCLTSSATSVLVAATLDVNGAEENIDIFKRGPVFFTAAELKKNLMQENQTELNKIFTNDDNGTVEASDGKKYRSIAESDVELVSKADGYMSLALTSEAAGKSWGSISETTENETTTKTFTASENDVLEKVNSGIGLIEGFKGGKMYYNIPIEHLGKFNTDKADNSVIKYNHKSYSATDAIEGQYGVVRNHWYQLSINSITTIGKGVYNPSEDIIPNRNESDLYYLAAEINVLSWHIVGQSVDL